jgi:diadenosine tetraphosphate (Ap4A) HIT family hydrolase
MVSGNSTAAFAAHWQPLRRGRNMRAALPLTAIMPLVFESPDFSIIAPEQPHVARSDGGHLIINPKTIVEDRTQLTRELAVELMKLTMVAGAAMKTVLIRKGIDIGRINYQDNGNWRHELHVHLYGRARGATIQTYGHPLAFPPTAEAFRRDMGNLEPLSDDDISELRTEIERLLASPKYRDF